MDLPSISDEDIRLQFSAFLDANGMTPDAGYTLILDGERHRYRIDGHKKGTKNGVYCVHTDALPAGWAQNWAGGDVMLWKYDTSGMSQEQKTWFTDQSPEAKAAREQRRKEAEKKNREKQIKASDSARITFETLPEAAEDHPYLKLKKVYAYGIKLNGTSLAIPLRDIDGKIKSLQWIKDDGTKLFYPDAPTKGLFWSVGLDTLKDHLDRPILVGEGFATTAKVYELTGIPAVAALNCGNLEPVCKALRKKYPKSKIIITADNDRLTELKGTVGNPGLDKARNVIAAKAAHDVVFPEFENPEDGTDWDDFALKYGDDKAGEILRQKIAWACMTEAQRKKYQAQQSLISLTHTLDPKIQLPPVDIIGGIFPRGYVSMLFAPPGTGKTIFIQKFCSDLSMGGSIYGGVAEDEPKRVSLILAGEAGYELLIRRSAAMKWEVAPERVKIVDQYEASLKNISLMFDNDEGFSNIEILVEINNPDIIIVDSLMSFHDKDENKGDQMKPILIKLAILARSKNIAIVLVHHSRKRLAKERLMSLDQNDVVGTGIFNRYIGLIVAIEPTQEEDSILLVKSVKSWFKSFMPFTYSIKEGLYGQAVLETDLAPSIVNDSRVKVWNYLLETFGTGNWFTRAEIVVSEIGGMPDSTLKRVLKTLENSGKLQTRGGKKNREYLIP